MIPIKTANRNILLTSASQIYCNGNTSIVVQLAILFNCCFSNHIRRLTIKCNPQLFGNKRTNPGNYLRKTNSHRESSGGGIVPTVFKQLRRAHCRSSCIELRQSHLNGINCKSAQGLCQLLASTTILHLITASSLQLLA